jgi:hypothetical protein
MLPNVEAAVPGDDPGDDSNSDSEDDPEGDSGDVDDPGSVAHAARHSSSLVNRFSLPLQPRNRENDTNGRRKIRQWIMQPIMKLSSKKNTQNELQFTVINILTRF